MPRWTLIVLVAVLMSALKAGHVVAQCTPRWLQTDTVPDLAGPSVMALQARDGGVYICGQDIYQSDTQFSDIIWLNPKTGERRLPGGGYNAWKAIWTILELPNGDVLAGGVFGSRPVARLSLATNTWQPVVDSLAFDVTAFALLPDSRVLVGGNFTLVNRDISQNVAIFNPEDNSWQPIPVGLNASVRSLTLLTGGDVLIDGYFTSAGGIAVPGIVRWSPTTGAWTPIARAARDSSRLSRARVLKRLRDGQIVLWTVYANQNTISSSGLTLYDPALDTLTSISMTFDTTSQLFNCEELGDGRLLCTGLSPVISPGANCFAALFSRDSSAVTLVGNLVNQTGYISGNTGSSPVTNGLLTLPDGRILITGLFSGWSGLGGAKFLSTYDQSLGSPVPTSPSANGPVYSFQPTRNGDILAAGDFTSLGRQYSPKLARWNHRTREWDALTSLTYPAGKVGSAFELPNGDILCSTNGSSTASVFSNGLVVFRPSTKEWLPYGPSLNVDTSSPYSLPTRLLPLDDGTLIVAGSFTLPSPRVARLDPTTGNLTPLYRGLNGSVNAALRLSNGDILIGGYFNSVGFARYQAATNTWMRSFSTVNGSINAFVPLQNGEILAVGYFTQVGLLPTAGLARYQPATDTWVPDLTASGQFLAAAVEPSGDIIISGRRDAVYKRLVGRYHVGSNGAASSWEPLPDPATPINGEDRGTWRAIALAKTGDIFLGNVDTETYSMYFSTTRYLAQYTSRPITLADVNCSGRVEVRDIFDFITMYFARLPSADINSDGVVSYTDIYDFLTAWFNGR